MSLSLTMPPSPLEIANNHASDRNHFLPRSASYNHLPTLSGSEPSRPDFRRTFSDLTAPTQSEAPLKEDVAAGKDILRRTSLRSKDRPTAVSRLNVSPEEVNGTVNGTANGTSEAIEVKVPETRPPEPVARPSKARSMSGRLANFARKPWISNTESRPPSPSSKSAKHRSFPLDEESPSRPSSSKSAQTGSGPESDATAPSRRRTVLYKRPRRPVIAVVAKSQEDHPSSPSSPSTQSPRSKGSLENLSASLHVSTPVLPARSKAATSTTSSFSSHLEHSQKRDELWGAFRALDADFAKFQSKSSALKANVIRSSLLSFLARHHADTSCRNLRPEDLDRRVNILNKWWTGLLGMLNGRLNQSISGTDRPVYLEAVVGVMSRPEWKVPFPSSQSSSSSPKPLKHASTSISESSEGSSSSEFLIESIHHNIRNIFTQNLLAQMSFVVDRMSLRHTPASLVAFCGKACAYAFFFCQGLADIFIRLWNTPPSVYRRIFAESGADKSSGARSFAQELAQSFPMTLRSLAFHSHGPLVRYLRQKPDVPLTVAQIPWQSPWVSRWCGRDTDLFFVFIKYIHILYADYLPQETDKTKRLLAPGLLPIHAQLLVVLEETLYKQSMPQMPENPHAAAAITFDDFIEGADASVSSLPLGAANNRRSMAENRLIMVLRDLLSETSVESDHARLFYAETFCGIMKTAARRTSLFDHNTCFLLCDFMEEAIPIIARYSQSTGMEVFDWKFWLDVCRQMMQSHNSLTEVRVFSFLFCIWNTWVATEERKASLCLDFLLHESLFYQYFNHWSPMVRAYFHRLLCWRVGRYNGEPSPLDSTIYEALSDRLQRIWAYYISFQAKADAELTSPLSSAPCTPAPGRRIIIIRCDNQLSPSSLFVSFDRVVPPAMSEQALGNRSSIDEDSEVQPPPKRRWNILKSMFGGSSRSGDGSSSSDESDVSDGGTVPEKPTDGQSQLPNGPGENLRPRTPHQPYSFKFSLEWMDRPQWPSKNKRLFTPCLPVAAQLHVQRRQSPVRMSDYDTESGYETENDTEDTQSASHRTRSILEDQVRGSGPIIPATEKASSTQDLQSMGLCGLAASKYAGRALAEWAQVVSECDSFFARRRDEGVPCDRMVETPTLGVESFRK